MRFLNEEGLQRLWGHIEDKFNKISEIINNVGRNTEEGGEIFNDYENNIAGIRGIKGEMVLSEEIVLQHTESIGGENYKNYSYENYSIEDFPYAVKDKLNCDNGFHLVKRFEVYNVEEFTIDGKKYLSVCIKDIGQPGKFQYQGMDGKVEDMDMETNCYFSCPDKPLAGDIIIPGKAMAAAAGEGNKSLGRASYVAGRNNKALQDCGFVAGRDNTAGYCGTGLGRNSDATGEYSTAIGYDANASGDISFATGQGTHASKKTSAAFNYYTKATGTGSAAFGNQTNSYGDYTFTQGVGTAAGWGNKVPGQVALGKYNKEDQSAILMVGNGTGSGDLRSNAFVVYEDGRAAIKADPKENLDISTKQYVDKALINNIPIKAQNTHSLYLNKSEGNNIDTSTDYAVVSGANCKIANSSIASFIAGGQRNEIKGQNSLAAGYKNKIYGNGAVAFGDTNTVGQVTIGSDNMATSFDKAANYSAVFGFNNKAQYANQFVIGKYNDNKTNTLFEIGNGTSNSGRKNALEVSTDGVTYTRMSKNEDLDIVATKGYVKTMSNRPNILNYLTYNIGNEQVGITGCDASFSGKCVIPEIIEGYPVTVIEDNAFRDHLGITDIIIPNGVTYIGHSALSGCLQLKSVTIPSTVTVIEEYVLYWHDYPIDVYYNGSKSQWLNIDNRSQFMDSDHNVIIHYALDIDQQYNSESTNAQSGIAVREAVAEISHDLNNINERIDILDKMCCHTETISLEEQTEMFTIALPTVLNCHYVSSVVLTDQNQKTIQCDIFIRDNANGHEQAEVDILFAQPITGIFNARIFYLAKYWN